MNREMAMMFLYRELHFLNNTILKIAEKLGVEDSYIDPGKKYLDSIEKIYRESE